jgi:hypothetical protein
MAGTGLGKKAKKAAPKKATKKTAKKKSARGGSQWSG